MIHQIPRSSTIENRRRFDGIEAVAVAVAACRRGCIVAVGGGGMPWLLHAAAAVFGSVFAWADVTRLTPTHQILGTT